MLIENNISKKLYRLPTNKVKKGSLLINTLLIARQKNI